MSNNERELLRQRFHDQIEATYDFTWCGKITVDELVDLLLADVSAILDGV